MKSTPRRVTQQQIAREAGVSQAAVSAILSGSGALNVSEDTRAAVLAAAEKLGYTLRRSASKAAAGPADKQNVLIVESEPPKSGANEEWLENAYQSFMGKILTTSGQCLQRHGLGLSVFYLGEPIKLTQWLAESDVAGVLWHASDRDSALLHWVASRFPLVLLNRDWKAAVPFDSVSVDQEQNILIAAEHLWKLGHRRIATFGHYAGNSFYRRRMSAYHQFVQERGLRDYREFQEISDDPAIPAMPTKVAAILDTWKKLGPEAPTALITSDVFALPMLREARAAGISVPRDLSVVGIDNTAPCPLTEPALSSMEQSFEEMCRIGVDLLLRRKANPAEPALTVQVAPSFVSRESVVRFADEAVPSA